MIKMLKKVLSFTLIMALLAGSGVIIKADSQDIIIMVNGNILNFDAPPVIQEGRTLVALRAVAEALGNEVSWDSKTSTITLKGTDVVVVLQINNKSASINDKLVTLDVPASIIKSRTMVPLRFIAEATGATVNWNGATNTVDIRSAKVTPTNAPTPSPTPSPTPTPIPRPKYSPNIEISNYPYLLMGNVVNQIGINFINNEGTDIDINRIEVYEKERMVTSYTKEDLEGYDIPVIIKSNTTWSMSISYKVGIWLSGSYVKYYFNYNNYSYYMSVEVNSGKVIDTNMKLVSPPNSTP